MKYAQIRTADSFGGLKMLESLSKTVKERIFRVAIRYGRLANQLNSALHCLVSAALRQPFWWTQNDDLPPSVGITGQVALGNGLAIQVTTARCAKDSVLVSFVYAHEIAHVVLEHYAAEQGSFLFGQYTRREAEADAFAYAYLYVTATVRTPCGGRIPYNAIYQAMKKLHGNDPGFYWSTNARHADILLINRILDDEGTRIPYPRESVRK